MLTEPTVFKKRKRFRVTGKCRDVLNAGGRPELHSADAQGSALLYRQGQRSDDSVTEGDTI